MIIYESKKLVIPVGLGPNYSAITPVGTLQEKTVDSSTKDQRVLPDSGYVGLYQVNVNKYVLDSSTVNITSNGNYSVESEANGLSRVDITVDVSDKPMQEKEVDSSTASQEVTADEGYGGLSKVTVNPYSLDEKTVDSSTVAQVVTSSVDGLSKVTVNPMVLSPLEVDSSTANQEFTGKYNNVKVNRVTSSIDSNIVAGNIKNGVEILGVQGTFDGGTLQDKTVDSSTVEQTITPDSGNYGLSSVKVNPYTLDSSSLVATQNGEFTITSAADGLSRVDVSVNIDTSSYYNEGYSDGEAAGIAEQKAKLDSSVFTTNGTYTREDGWNEIEVAVPGINNQNKTVDSSTAQQTVTFDSGYSGLGTVTINPYFLQYKVANAPFKYMDSDSNPGAFYVRPDASYNGLDIVAVPYAGILSSKTFTPTTSQQSWDAYDDTDELVGLKTVVINAVTSSIDSNIQAGNIKKNVTILGVTGTFDGGTLQSKTVDSSTSSQTIVPSSGYYGLSRVVVNPYTLDSSYMTITQSGLYTINAEDMGVDGLSQVDVSVNVQGGGGNPEAGQGDPSTSSVTYYPNYPYDSFSEFTVNAVDASIDSNIQPENIKAGVNILGVQGTYEGSDGAIRLEYISNENSPTLAFDSSYIPGKKTRITANLSFGGQGQSFWGVYMGLQDVWNLREVSGYGTNDLAFQTEADDPQVNDAYPAPDDFSTIHSVEFGCYPSEVWDEHGQHFDYYPYINDSSAGYDSPQSDPLTTDRFDYSMYIFAGRSNSDGSLTEYTGRQMRLHEMWISEYDENTWNWIDVKHFIPYQDASGNACLYEEYSDTYVYAFSGTPGAGPTMKYQKKEVSCSDQEQLILPDNGFPAMSQVTILAADRNIDPMIQENNIKSGITILGCTGTYTGSQFYRLEWASNGDRCLYRDTGINVTEDTYIECTLSFGDQQTEQVGYGYFWGVRDSNFGGQCFNMRENGGYGARQIQFNNPSWETYTQDLPHAPRTWSFGQVDPDGTGQNNYSFYRYNGVIDKRDPYTITDGYSVNTIYLWAQNNDGQGIDEYSDREVRIHEFKIWQNGQLVRHIVPVANNDGAIEMFDLINMEVLPGEGWLVGGPRYEEVDLDNYIENGTYDGSVGNVYFNLGSMADFFDLSDMSAYTDQYLEIVASTPKTPSSANDTFAIIGGDDNNVNSWFAISKGWNAVDSRPMLVHCGGGALSNYPGITDQTALGKRALSNVVHRYKMASCYAHGGATYAGQTELEVDEVPTAIRETNILQSQPSGDVYLFAHRNYGTTPATQGFAPKGTRIYQVKYYNVTDGAIHVLVPAYDNGQYCFLDKSTGTYIYASAGTPTGYIKDRYYEDCVEIHDNRT